MASYHEKTRTRKDGTTYKVWCGQEKINNKIKTVYGKTQKECKAKMKALIADEVVYGDDLCKTTDTVSDLLYEHLFTNIHPSVLPSTFDRYMCLYNKHIKDTTFGKIRVTEIKQKEIQSWFNTKTEIASKALSMIRYLLRQSFDFAIVNNYVRSNPVINIKLPKENASVKKKNIEVLTIEEQEKYMGALNHTKYKVLYLTALFTGMRRGEILALKWDNVDLKGKVIRVVESRKRYKKYNADGTSENLISDGNTKTDNSRRTIPINSTLNKVLLEHKMKQDVFNPDNYVFINSNGTSIQPEYLRLMQQSICKRAGIPYKNFHVLRHTFATRLIEGGVDVKTVSKLLGHSDILITLNTYVHETMDSKRSATDLLEGKFKTLI